MKSVSLSGSPRENVGKKDAKRHRRDGKIPCVVYGGKEQVHFVADEKPLMKIFHTAEVFIVKLDINGKVHDTIIQDVQYHPVTDRILHVDFLEAAENKPVTIAIPIHLHGTSEGVLKGGRLVKKTRKVIVKGLAKDLPDYVDVDITPLEINDSVKISDLKATANVVFLDPPTNIVVGVRTARAVVEEVAPGAAAAEGAAPAEGEAPAEGAAPAKGEKKKEGK
jgi:large subunit ribosomal protein L25